MKVYQLLAIVCILFLLTGCRQKENGEMNNMQNDKFAGSPTISISNSVGETQRYTDVQLSEIADYTGTTDKLLLQYPPYSVFTAEEVQGIIYFGETKSLELAFDASGSKIIERFHNLTVSKSEFEVLSVGSLLSEVREIDPQGAYLFLYTGRNDVPKISTHYTTDGFIISITYDENNVIESIAIDQGQGNGTK